MGNQKDAFSTIEWLFFLQICVRHLFKTALPTQTPVVLIGGALEEKPSRGGAVGGTNPFSRE